MRGATLYELILHTHKGISIHAPHAGSDYPLKAVMGAEQISIHAPHAGSDAFLFSSAYDLSQFQSTLPMRGATGLF